MNCVTHFMWLCRNYCAKMQMHSLPLLQPQLGTIQGLSLGGPDMQILDFSRMAGLRDGSTLLIWECGHRSNL